VHEAITKKCVNESQVMQILRDEHISMVKSQPEIEKRLWTVDEYAEHVIHREKNPRDFIKDYFGEGGLCNKRVMDIRTLFFHLKFFPTDKSKFASHVSVTNPVVQSVNHTLAANSKITCTSSPVTAGRPDSPECRKQPSFWNVSPNNDVNRQASLIMDYLNSKIVAKNKHIEDARACSQNESWSKSTPHVSNEKSFDTQPVMNLLSPGASWTTELDNNSNGVCVTSTLATPAASDCISNDSSSAPTDPMCIAVPSTLDHVPRVTHAAAAFAVDGVDKGGTSVIVTSQVSGTGSVDTSANQSTLQESTLATPMVNCNSNTCCFKYTNRSSYCCCSKYIRRCGCN